MRPRRMLLVYALSAVFATASLASARTMTLDDCIEHALETRESIIRARGFESTANADKRAALGAFLPRINASYSWGKSQELDGFFGSAIGTSPTSKSTRVSASMDILDVTNFFNYFGARADAASASLNVIDSEDDLIYSVKTTYYAYLANVEAVDVQQQAVERSQEQLKLIQSRFDLGSANRSEVLRQQVLLGNDQLALLRAENAVVTSRANLAFTIGIDPNSDVEFQTDATANGYDGTLDEALAYGLNNEPGLMAARKDISASKNAVRSRWASYLPQFGVSADVTRSEGATFIQGIGSIDTEFNTRSWSFGITWNIFDGFNRERNLTSARVTLNNSRAAEADTRNFVVSEIKSAYFAIEQQRQARDVAQTNVDAAEEDMKITQEKYNLGAATILDLLTAQVNLQEAQRSLVQATFDLNLAISRLEAAMGKR